MIIPNTFLEGWSNDICFEIFHVYPGLWSSGLAEHFTKSLLNLFLFKLIHSNCLYQSERPANLDKNHPKHIGLRIRTNLICQ